MKETGWQRTIIHLDMDAFFAAVEQRDNPTLRGMPVLVGGSRERGVVCACSYEARPYGVRSAMAIARALRLCPQAVLLPVRMTRYREVSRQIFSIFARFTDLVEPLSIDEAFLDVTASRRLFGNGRTIAERIRREVRAETGLAVSAGVAPNKFLAKLASETAKPDGLYELTAAVDDFLLPLPLARLWGVGQVTAERLERLGLRTVADARRAGRELLQRHFGTAGEHLFALAHGEDTRPVMPEEGAKSVGHEETFERDLDDVEELRRQLLSLAERVARRLRRRQEVGRCLTVKVRYADFVTVTRRSTFAAATDHGLTIYRQAAELLARTEAGRRPVRLLGLAMSQLAVVGSGQQELFGAGESERLGALDRAIDRVIDRFGSELIGRGTLLMPGRRGKKGST